MGQLIDEDDFKNWLQERIEGYKQLNCGGNNRSAELEVIKEELAIRVPTAYDPDKAVARLLAASFERYGNEGMGGQKVVALDDAIEIVRGDREPEPECEWKLEDAEGNLYATGCENRQLIFEGTPEENGYKYCPYCGKRIKEVE